MSNSVLSRRIQLNLTDWMDDELYELAHQVGISKAEMLRFLIRIMLNSYEDAPEETVRRLRRQIIGERVK